MIIRDLTLEQDDMLRFMKFMKAFDQESAEVHVDVEYAAKRYGDMVRQGIAHIIVAEDSSGNYLGSLGFVVAYGLHENVFFAVETFWYVAPEHRGIGRELLFAFEGKALELGCQKTAMIHLVDSYPESLKVFYERNGYHLTESHYVKDLA